MGRGGVRIRKEDTWLEPGARDKEKDSKPAAEAESLDMKQRRNDGEATKGSEAADPQVN